MSIAGLFSTLCALSAKRAQQPDHACERTDYTKQQTYQQQDRLCAELPVKQPACAYPRPDAAHYKPADARDTGEESCVLLPTAANRTTLVVVAGSLFIR